MSSNPSASRDQQEHHPGEKDDVDDDSQHHLRSNAAGASYEFDELLSRNSLLQTPRTTMTINDRFLLSPLMSAGFTTGNFMETPSRIGVLPSPNSANSMLSPQASLLRNEGHRWNQYLKAQLQSNIEQGSNTSKKSNHQDYMLWGSPESSTFALRQNFISPDKSVGGSQGNTQRQQQLSPPHPSQTVHPQAHANHAFSLAAPKLDGLTELTKIGASSLNGRLFMNHGRKLGGTEDDLKVGNILKRLRHHGGMMGNDEAGDETKTRHKRRRLGGGCFPMPSLHGAGHGKDGSNIAVSLSSFRNEWQAILSRQPKEVDGVSIDADQERRFVRETFGTALTRATIPLSKNSSNSIS